MKRKVILKKIFPVVLFLILTLVLFYKIFLGFYPFAGNLLVSFFFPWSNGGWEGFDPWTTHKEFIGSDSIRMQLPWKVLAFDLIKKGQLPLWNPYNFSGSPLLANYQSGLLYPFNLLYLIFHPLTAWNLLTMLQFFLAMFFMFLLLQKLKISKSGSILGSIAFVSSSFFITWVEIDIIGHTYLWLPLIIYFIELILTDQRRYFYPIVSLLIAFSIFAGYPQTAILIIFYSILYFLFRSRFLSKRIRESVCFFLFQESRKPWPFRPRMKAESGSDNEPLERKNGFLPIGKNQGLLALGSLFLGLGLGLAAVQLIPSLELYQQAPLSKEFARWTFEHFLVPYHQLITFFAPDFFGNPATNNFWGRDYGDLTPSIGVIPLFFAFIPIFLKRKDKLFKFLYFTSIVFFLLAISSPLSFLVKTIRLPVLSSGTPARILSLLFFNLSILSAFGFDVFFTPQSLQSKIGFSLNKIKAGRLPKQTLSGIKILIIVFFLIYILLWLFAIFGAKIFPLNESLKINLSVTRRNLILPTISFSAIFGIFVSHLVFNHLKMSTKKIPWQTMISKFFVSLSMAIILGLVFLNLFYRLNKYNPFSPKKFYFPSHPVIEFLKDKTTVSDRFYGVDTAHFGDNFATFYKIYAAEGYDTLRIDRYAELVAAVEKGEIPKEYLRSDARFPAQESENRRKIFNLLGIKYILDKDDAVTKGWEPQPWKFPENRFKLIWQNEKFKVYRNVEAFPRAFLVNNYVIEDKGERIIDKLFSKDFDLKKTLILEEELKDINIDNKATGSAEIVVYTPNEVKIRIQSSGKMILFLSDAYFPGWKAYLEDKEVRIYRADYAFRALVVPKGESEVFFKYFPKSFYYGAIISGVSFIFITLIWLYFFIKEKQGLSPC